MSDLNVTKTPDGKMYIDGTTLPVKLVLYTKLPCGKLTITIDNFLSGDADVDDDIIDAFRRSLERNFQMSAGIQLNSDVISGDDIWKYEVLDSNGNLLIVVYNDKVIANEFVYI